MAQATQAVRPPRAVGSLSCGASTRSGSRGTRCRYLGLPGTDLLDLRYLHEELCRASDRPMRFLGFNTEAQRGNAAQVQLNVSLDEVRRLPNVDAQSEVMHDDFRLIGNPSIRSRGIGLSSSARSTSSTSTSATGLRPTHRRTTNRCTKRWRS